MFHQGCLVSAEEAICCGHVEGFLQQSVAKTLRRLCQYDAFAGKCGMDQGTVGGAFNLLDRIHSREAGYRGAVFFDSRQNFLDDLHRNQRPYGVMHENDIARVRLDGVQGVGDRLLPVLSTFHELDLLASKTAVLQAKLFRKPFTETSDFSLAQGDPDFGYFRHLGESAQAMNQDGRSRALRDDDVRDIGERIRADPAESGR